MFAFSRSLPQQFDQPLPMMMTQLTPEFPDLAQKTEFAENSGNMHESPALSEDDIRQLADAVAAWHFWSSLGICLRRSLLRYHFLRAAKVPVSIVFGARLKGEQEDGDLGGHAWVILDDRPYYENPEDYEQFVAMYRYPPDSSRQADNNRSNSEVEA